MRATSVPAVAETGTFAGGLMSHRNDATMSAGQSECPVCGHMMEGYLCRLVCPNCGNCEDCSDAFRAGPIEAPRQERDRAERSHRDSTDA